MSRVQLALRVSDLEASITFYSKLVGVEPAKRQPGYANFAVAEPPLKRLCLAQALALDPALLLLDEPTSARDNAARDVVEAAVAGLAARRTVVLVSHDAEQVQRLCGHIIDLHVESDSAAPTQPGMTSTAPTPPSRGTADAVLIVRQDETTDESGCAGDKSHHTGDTVHRARRST